VSRTLRFDGAFQYKNLPGFSPMPSAEVILHMGDSHTGTVFAILDTGATVTIFQPELALDLGIEDITTAPIFETVSTGGGPIRAYQFQVEMELALNGHRSRFGCTVGLAERHIPRNILGRNLVFQHYTFAFRERESEVLFIQL
jgi:hypothetical protein